MRRGRALLDRADADRAIGFVVAAAAPFALAVQGGGYDIVAREFTSLAIWWLIALGMAFGLLPRARPPRSMRLPLAGLVVLVGWTAASLLWTSSAEDTFAELARILGYGGVAVLDPCDGESRLGSEECRARMRMGVFGDGER